MPPLSRVILVQRAESLLMSTSPEEGVELLHMLALASETYIPPERISVALRKYPICGGKST